MSNGPHKHDDTQGHPRIEKYLFDCEIIEKTRRSKRGEMQGEPSFQNQLGIVWNQ